MRFALALLLAAGAPVLAAPVPKELKQPDDKERIVGTWKPADQKTAWFTFRADGTLETWNPPGDNSPMQWRWTDLDPKASPKRMTLTRVSDKQVYTCPYDLTADGMRFAFCTPGQMLSPDPAMWGGDTRQLARDTTRK